MENKFIKLYLDIEKFKEDKDWNELVISKEGFKVLCDLLDYILDTNREYYKRIENLEKYLLSDLDLLNDLNLKECD